MRDPAWANSTGVEKLGLKDAMIQFGGLPDKSRSVYVAYYRRNGG
ncbi:MAG TPA: hypothetical protein VK533_02700 [Sphingomonas sp.]|nr:hypothetical protein [Sphingomonas sp.]HMI18433.1 hypothetical protein [Sphingomonas sp.]